MKSILDPTFNYTPSASTDLRKTFARVRREMRKTRARRSRDIREGVADLRAATACGRVAVALKIWGRARGNGVLARPVSIGRQEPARRS